jgi:peptidoglycan/LPS O-acetylase OafA/YrhL
MATDPHQSPVAPFPVEVSKTTPHGLRIDIQLLRALAIILVVLHHAHVPFVPGGFLGVDIFFVVSGYLMTGIIARELEQGTFSFAGFYARRVRRLLPAAYATLAVTAALAPFLLDQWEYRDFFAQLAGSFTFVVNMVLWQQSDYFNSGAGMKPLLHMWSLAVEEQYYIVLPLLLFLCPRKLRLALGVLLTLTSGALCIWLLQRSPSATFYFLPTRAWELGIGSVMALLVRAGLFGERRMPLLRLACALVLIAVPLITDERGHPGLTAFVVCLATAVLMIPGLNLPQSPALRPFVMVGDRSYSLYLVHWPVYAFANNIFIDPVPGWVNAVLIVPVLLWMEAQYRLAEKPFRAMRLTWSRLAILILVPLIVLGGSYGYKHMLGRPDAEVRAGNTGIGASCNFKDDYVPSKDCMTGPASHTMLWGDSFAMHLGTLPYPPPAVLSRRRELNVAPSSALRRSTVRSRRWTGRSAALPSTIRCWHHSPGRRRSIPLSCPAPWPNIFRTWRRAGKAQSARARTRSSSHSGSTR